MEGIRNKGSQEKPTVQNINILAMGRTEDHMRQKNHRAARGKPDRHCVMEGSGTECFRHHKVVNAGQFWEQF